MINGINAIQLKPRSTTKKLKSFLSSKKYVRLIIIKTITAARLKVTMCNESLYLRVFSSTMPIVTVPKIPETRSFRPIIDIYGAVNSNGSKRFAIRMFITLSAPKGNAKAITSSRKL